MQLYNYCMLIGLGFSEKRLRHSKKVRAMEASLVTSKLVERKTQHLHLKRRGPGVLAELFSVNTGRLRRYEESLSWVHAE
jgi:hypothetical protein